MELNFHKRNPRNLSLFFFLFFLWKKKKSTTTKETTNPIGETMKTRDQNTKNRNHKPSWWTQQWTTNLVDEPSDEPMNLVSEPTNQKTQATNPSNKTQNPRTQAMNPQTQAAKPMNPSSDWTHECVIPQVKVVFPLFLSFFMQIEFHSKTIPTDSICYSELESKRLEILVS